MCMGNENENEKGEKKKKIAEVYLSQHHIYSGSLLMSIHGKKRRFTLF